MTCKHVVPLKSLAGYLLFVVYVREAAIVTEFLRSSSVHSFTAMLVKL
jgi:hypothetical protein